MQLVFPVRRGPYIPAGIARVNTAHPMATYLQSAIIPIGNKQFDLLGYQGPSTPQTGTPTMEFGQAGAYVGFASTGNQMTRTLTAPLSCIVLCVRTVTPNGSAEGNKIAPVVATNTDGIYVDAGNLYGNANKFYASNYDAAWIDGAKQSGTNPCDVTITNGQWYCVGGTASTISGSASTLVFGRQFKGGAGTNYWMLGGGVALCLVFNRVLPDAWMAELTRDPGQMLLWPEDEIFATLGALANITVALTGQSATFSQGNVGVSTSVALTGQAITSAQGSVSTSRTVALTGTAATFAQGDVTVGDGAVDTHDGWRKRSRRERRIDELLKRRDEERLADAQSLRLALEAALGIVAEVPEPAPVVVAAVAKAPKPAEVDWRRIAEDDAQYERLSRLVRRLSALAEAEMRRIADEEDDDDAAFLLGSV